MLALFQFQNNAKVLDPWNTAGIQIKILRFLAAVFQVLSVVCTLSRCNSIRYYSTQYMVGRTLMLDHIKEYLIVN